MRSKSCRQIRRRQTPGLFSTSTMLPNKSVVVRTPDSDIFFILLHHSHSIGLNIYLDIGMGKHRQIINVTELAKSFEPEYCTTLLGLYVFSGEDCTSAFKGKGKVGPLKSSRTRRTPSTRRLSDNLVMIGQ